MPEPPTLHGEDCIRYLRSMPEPPTLHSWNISGARAEGDQPDVLGDDTVCAVAEVEVNEIGETRHRSQAEGKSARELSREEEEVMRCVSQWTSLKPGGTRGIYTAKRGCVWKMEPWREYGSRAGRVSLSFRDKMWFLFQFPE